jgi:hypothetical protein
MQRIGFEVIWTDDDGMFQLGVRVESATHSAYHETYTYPAGLLKFGEALAAYPNVVSSQVIFEAGSLNPEFHDFFRLKVFMLKVTGQSALEFTSVVRGSPPICSEDHFFVSGLPADFNRLGVALQDWLKKPDVPLVVEWLSA